MKATNTLFIIALTLAAFTAGAWAESPASPAPAAAAAAPAPAPTTVTAADVQSLKDALAAQQLQIERLTKQLELQQAWQLRRSGAASSDAPQPAPEQLAAVSTTVAVPQSGTSGPGLNMQENPPPSSNPLESPVISIHFKGITITPAGFAEAEFVRRSRALAADLPTPFNSLTMPGASQSNLSEFFGSGRQSRPTIYVDGRMKNVEFSSYVSGDFLSSG